MPHDTPESDRDKIRLSLDRSLDGGTPSSATVAPAAPEANAPAAASSSPGYGGYGAYGGVGYNGLGYGDDNRLHLSDHVRVLYKRRWVALTAFLLIFGFVVLHTFTTTPVYRARIMILIDNQSQNVMKFEEVLQQNQRAIEYYQTQYRILSSRALARRTLDAAKLWKHELIARSVPSGIPLNPLTWVNRAMGAVQRTFQADPAPPSADSAETMAQSQAIDRFLSNLEVASVRASQLVEVTYEAPDPKFAAEVANALGAAYIDQNLEFRFTATRDANRFLEQRMTEQRNAVEQSEQALQKYREQTASVSLEGQQNIVVQRLEALNTEVTRARATRIQKETVYQQVRAIENDRAALDTVPAVLSNSYIQQLKGELGNLQRLQNQQAQTLGPRNSELKATQSAIAQADAKLAAEVTKVVQGLRNDFEAALAEERQLAAALAEQNNQALALNRLGIEYGVLQRDAASNKQIFEGLLQRTKETDVSGELRTSNIRIVDQAEVPRSPSYPNTRTNLMLGFGGGMVFAMILAFFVEYIDTRIKSPLEIKAHLGLPFLGIIPALDPKAITGTAPLLNTGVPHEFAEAFRMLRTNVLFASADSGSKSIVVTSTAPGEGKSLVSANLATALALAGSRVVVIDADMRRPKLHETFGVAQEPGLSNVLVGEAKASDSIRQTSLASLWVLPAGKNPPNPAELLGSRRFKSFLDLLGGQFDWVILDTPPVMAVADAAIVAHLATGVVFVVGSEMISRGAAKAALDQLDAAKAKHVGAVLNRVDLHRHSYYYSQYYRREYAQPYSQG